MSDSGNQRVRSNHHVVTDINLTDVEDGEVVVAGEVIADEDVLAAVAVEGLGDPHTLAHRTQHLIKHIKINAKKMFM